MIKPEKAVIDTTRYIAVFTVILTVLMHAVFLVLHHWDLTVLWGSLLGTATAILNFFLRGLTVQKAVTKEEKEARDAIRLSYTLRTLMLVIVGVIGAVVPVFHVLAVLIPLFFPRMAIMFYPMLHKKEGDHS